MHIIDAPPVSQFLAAHHVPHRVFRHPGSVVSLEQAAQERGQQVAQIVRSILFRLGQDAYAMVLVAGPGQIDWRALRRFVGQSRLTTASEAEVLQVTGYPIGAVAPFGVPHPLRVLVDESVIAQTEVSIGSGLRGTTVILRVDDLMHALGNAEVGGFRIEKESQEETKGDDHDQAN